MSMTKLSNSDSRTIRQARAALNLLMRGALSELETNYGPSDPDRSVATDALLLHMREEVESYNTSHEMDTRPVELTSEETALVE